MTANPSSPWHEANQRYLLAEFGALKARLCGAPAEYPAGVLAEARANLQEPAAIDQLSRLFGLSRFERALLLLCAGVEMDADLAAQCAIANGNPQRREASFGLGLAVLDEAHWSALTPDAPLRRWRLLEPESGPLTMTPLRIDERILHYIAGINALDARLRPYVQARSQVTGIAHDHAETALAVADSLRREGKSPPVVVLAGEDSEGQEDAAAQVAGQLGFLMYEISAADTPASAPELESFATLWSREACLLPAALFIRSHAGPPAAAVRSLIESAAGLVFLACRDPCTLRRPMRVFHVGKPEPAEQRRLWTQALGMSASRLNGTLDLLAGQFRLSARTISRIAADVAMETEADAGEDRSVPDALWRACRSLGRERLDDLAQRLDSCACWDDLILPAHEGATLRQISAQVRHRLKVYGAWGFAGRAGARGAGITALFAGESGTGKTLAAEVLARELRLDLYRVDLSSIVSKYIGETEKNLKRVFDAAEDTGAVLLFDEADALFGRRSEVKDSHDRYANIEVSYLLQRMETYGGLAILTTNLRSLLDRAFVRRLRFVVQFPFPDPKQREEIWRRSFPSGAPMRGIDVSRLAQANLAGGSIRNIALNAAFLAAEEDVPLGMAHLLQAARSEGQKIERPLTDFETRGWV